MRAVPVAMIAFVLVCVPANACEPHMFDANEMVTNEPVYSENGRYCVIERWYERLEDFKSARAGALFGFDTPEPESDVAATPVERRNAVTFAMYESSTRKQLSEFSVPFRDEGVALVTDSGRYAVIVHPLDYRCYGYAEPANALVTIFRSDGTRVGRLQVSDVLTASDIAVSSFERTTAFSYALRRESETREVLVLSFDGRQRRIDLDTASLLDPRENLLPAPAVLADDVPRSRDFGSGPFDDNGAIHLKSKDLLARAVDEPLLPYPEVARKARVAGTVWVQVVVSEYGNVAALRSTSLPFGLDAAATSSVKEWRFQPLSVGREACEVHRRSGDSFHTRSPAVEIIAGSRGG